MNNDYDFWKKCLGQLGDKDKQLRDKENKLRDEKLLLLQRQSGKIYLFELFFESFCFLNINSQVFIRVLFFFRYN